MNKEKTIITQSGSELDNDLEALHLGIKAMEISTPRMRKPTLEYLWDRYVTHGNKDKAPKTEGE